MASTWPAATVSPTFTLMALTVPAVAKSAAMVAEDSIVPSVATVAVTVPTLTGTVRTLPVPALACDPPLVTMK